MAQVVVATHNQHKFRELSFLLQGLPFDFVVLGEFTQVAAEETGTTFVENALLKARLACRETKRPAIADDSGLVVECLDGQPGVYSSRYAGVHASDEENCSLLLANLAAKSNPTKPIKAHFCCALVYLSSANDPNPLVAEGSWHGQIVTPPRGSNGFGYDPIFQPRDSLHTAAELDPHVKNTVSHRARAIEQFKSLVQELL